MKLATVALTLLFATAGAHAQAVFRCGNVYSQTACPQARVVEASDPRSAAQRAEAGRVVAGERKLAADMRRDRLAEERGLVPARAGSLSAAKPAPAKPATSGERSAAKKKQKRASVSAGAGEDFVASTPSTKKKRTR